MGQTSHNAGMQDGAKGEYNPEGYDQGDYDAGYSYGRGERHGSNGEYNNSHSHPENQDKYDEGWKNGYHNH